MLIARTKDTATPTKVPLMDFLAFLGNFFFQIIHNINPTIGMKKPKINHPKLPLSTLGGFAGVFFLCGFVCNPFGTISLLDCNEILLISFRLRDGVPQTGHILSPSSNFLPHFVQNIFSPLFALIPHSLKLDKFFITKLRCFCVSRRFSCVFCHQLI